MHIISCSDHQLATKCHALNASVELAQKLKTNPENEPKMMTSEMRIYMGSHKAGDA